jgi:hypothetical protein
MLKLVNNPLNYFIKIKDYDHLFTDPINVQKTLIPIPYPY